MPPYGRDGLALAEPLAVGSTSSANCALSMIRLGASSRATRSIMARGAALAITSASQPARMAARLATQNAPPDGTVTATKEPGAQRSSIACAAAVIAVRSARLVHSRPSGSVTRTRSGSMAHCCASAAKTRFIARQPRERGSPLVRDYSRHRGAVGTGGYAARIQRVSGWHTWTQAPNNGPRLPVERRQTHQRAASQIRVLIRAAGWGQTEDHGIRGRRNLLQVGTRG